MSVTPSPTQQTRGKNHESSSIRYNAISVLPFGDISLLASNATTSGTASGQFLPLPLTCKIMGVSMVAVGNTLGLSLFNICMGTGAYSGIPTADNTEAGIAPPTPATNGNCVFNMAGNAPGAGTATIGVDQLITLASGVPQTVLVPPPYLDAVWPQNALMTFRYASGTISSGALLKVALLVVPYDPVPWRPSTTLNGTAPTLPFNPVNDIR